MGVGTTGIGVGFTGDGIAFVEWEECGYNAYVRHLQQQRQL